MDINTGVLLLVAVMNAATLYFTRQTEKNTNSMKDALVKSTSIAAHAAGRDEMRAEAEAEAAVVAKGVTQGIATLAAGDAKVAEGVKQGKNLP